MATKTIQEALNDKVGDDPLREIWIGWMEDAGWTITREEWYDSVDDLPEMPFTERGAEIIAWSEDYVYTVERDENDTGGPWFRRTPRNPEVKRTER